MNKKSIGALLLSAALFVSATASTFAYFTNTTNTDAQHITMGAVKVDFMSQSNWNLVARNMKLDTFKGVNISNLALPTTEDSDEIVKPNVETIQNVAPGDVLVKTFTLQNNGSLDAKVRLYLENLTVTNPDGSQVSNTDPIMIDLSNFDFKAYVLNADGTLGKEVTLGLYPDYVTLDANTNESVVIYVGACISNTMTNAGMNKSINFDVKADATQWNNPGWNQ